LFWGFILDTSFRIKNRNLPKQKLICSWNKPEDTEGLISSRKSKDIYYNDKQKEKQTILLKESSDFAKTYVSCCYDCS
jgi:hypothetical protein